MHIVNRSATHDYSILVRFEAGIKLTGPEVKSVRGNRVSLAGSFVRIIGSEAYLVNAQIQPYTFARVIGYDPRRTRKLLVSKKEIISLKTKSDSEGLTLIPLTLYTHGNFIKLEVGVAKGKKQYDRRQELKQRAQKRELEHQFRGKVK